MDRNQSILLLTAVRAQEDGDEEFHGFQLASLAQQAGCTKRIMVQGTLYNALSALERDGLLISHLESAADAAQAARPRRRLYRVTRAGEDAAAALSV